MRRMSVSPIDEEQIVSTNFRRRSSVVLARKPIRQEVEVDHGQSSQIVEFYTGRSVFVTGASGFIGKLLIEKLLRTCPDVKRIFVLIRPRRNKSASERLGELFNSAIFDDLRTTLAAKNGDENESADAAFVCLLQDKIRLLEGDLTEPLLGLSKDEISQMANEVSVILHSAAMVSFDGKLRQTIRTNLSGTNNVLEVACRLPKLSSFVHVSTCYSNCTRFEIDEHIYPVEVEPTQIINLAECLDDEMVDMLRKKLVGNHPNPYTYTKHLAEYLAGEYALGKRLPVIICRPSIVVSTLEEPLVGFTDNRNGMNGIFWAMNRGLLRTASGLDSSLVDQVPSDVVVNSILALGWFGELYHRVGNCLERNMQPPEPVSGQPIEAMVEYYEWRKAKLAHKLSSDETLRSLRHRELMHVPVCHVSSGVENPITFYDMLDYVAKGGKRYPSINLFREPRCNFTPNQWVHKLQRFWYHTLAGFLLNLFAVGLIVTGPTKKTLGVINQPTSGGQQARVTRTDWLRDFSRVDRFVGVLTYFMSNSWYFNPETRQKLMRDFMNGADNRLFNCDTSFIDWKHFGDRIAFGMRKYVLGEREETIEEARQKFRQTNRRNSMITIFLITGVFYIVYMLVLF